jgi:hypothetical protein
MCASQRAGERVIIGTEAQELRTLALATALLALREDTATPDLRRIRASLCGNATGLSNVLCQAWSGTIILIGPLLKKRREWFVDFFMLHRAVEWVILV